MTRKTHIAVGIAASSLILNPGSPSIYLLTIASSTIGAILPDIDVSTSESHKEINIISFISLVLILASLLIDHYKNLGLIAMIQSNDSLTNMIISIPIFLFFCAHGLHTKHRSFTHSFAALAIFTTLVYFIFKPAVIAFFIGYLSHILLDLFNRQSVQLFYPFTNGIKFDLCDSDGLVNDLLCIAAMIIIIIH